MAQLPYTDPETADRVMKAVFEDTVKRFQMPLNADSDAFRTPVPIHFGHLFRRFRTPPEEVGIALA